MPKHKFTTIGSGKVVHVITTKAADLKANSTTNGSQCPQVRKAWVSDKFAKVKGLSPEAAAALDPCSRCKTAEVANADIKANETPEERRAKADEKRDDALARAKNLTKGEQRKKDKAQGKVGRPKAEKTDKPKKERKASMTKSGPRSIGGSGEDKAAQLAAFAVEHGWSSEVVKDGQHLRVTAVRNDETINVWYIDGKYDPARPAVVVAGDWHGKLRGAHSARRQMSGEGRDRPHPSPGKGRVKSKAKGKGKTEDEVIPENESPEDAKRRVPFAMDDDALVILDTIKGKMIKWRNGTSGAVEEAWLPSKIDGKKRATMSITEHPKHGKRILNFITVLSVTEDGPVYGPERSVYLEKIIRVNG